MGTSRYSQLFANRHAPTMASLAIFALMFTIIVPENVPLLPYVHLNNFSTLLSVRESLLNMEIPEWNPYIGGGHPLAPSPYYLLYGISRITFMTILLLLSLIVALAPASRLLSLLLAFPPMVLSAYAITPFPIVLACYIAGMLMNSELRRIIGSLAIPELALCTELVLPSPSPPVIIVSLLCTVDMLAAYAGEVLIRHFSPYYLAYLAATTAAAMLLSIGAAVVLARLDKRWKWKRPIAPMVVLTTVSFMSTGNLHPICLSPVLYPLVAISCLLLRRVDDTLTKIERRVILVRATIPLLGVTILVLSLAPLTVLSKPKFTVDGEVVIGSGAVGVVSPDPWFTTAFRFVMRGHPVLNSPFIADTPTTASMALLLYQVGDTRYFVVPPSVIVEPDIDLKVRLVLPQIVSPHKLAIESMDQVTQAKLWFQALRGPTLEEPKILSPRAISGDGLVAQGYSLWWTNALPGPAYMLRVHGVAHYDRPTAPASLLLVLLSTAVAVVKAAKRKRDSS